MKTLFTSLICAAVMVAAAQDRNYRPATQAEVNAGSNNFAGVTPATLKGWNGSSANVITNSGQAILQGYAGARGQTNVLTIVPSTSSLYSIWVTTLGSGAPAFDVDPAGNVMASGNLTAGSFSGNGGNLANVIAIPQGTDWSVSYPQGDGEGQIVIQNSRDGGSFTFDSPGIFTANSFNGDGSQLVNLNASSFASGTMPVARAPGITTNLQFKIPTVSTNTLYFTNGILMRVTSP